MKYVDDSTVYTWRVGVISNNVVVGGGLLVLFV
jgi:hypothetical protein